MTTLNIASYNIHKGYTHFNRRVMLHELREQLHRLGPDIVFLQEVCGEHTRQTWRRLEAPAGPQHEFLALEGWPHLAYGQNRETRHGHHGNAILSRYPILRWDNQDISAHRFEGRGALHCEIALPDRPHPLHCLCVHLGLFKPGRTQQMGDLVARIRRLVPDEAPLIIAGDFNDWNNHAGRQLAQELGLHEAFEHCHGRLARSFPAHLPLLRLDRIYVRGLQVTSGTVLSGAPWNKLSDHAPLSVTLELG